LEFGIPLRSSIRKPHRRDAPASSTGHAPRALASASESEQVLQGSTATVKSFLCVFRVQAAMAKPESYVRDCFHVEAKSNGFLVTREVQSTEAGLQARCEELLGCSCARSSDNREVFGAPGVIADE
jgi:hypothetical protein